MSSSRTRSSPQWLDTLIPVAFTVGIATLWTTLVNQSVEDPYLDEVFHIRQAQVYCSGNFHVWDPKITTPPGLYLISYLIYRLTGWCSIESLRGLNLFTVLIGAVFTYPIFNRVHAHSPDNSLKLSALNTWLFPPLFFFSALYYTDVQSTFWVLLAYQGYLKFENNGFSKWSDALSQVKFGIIALFFRQTNVFWVAVFPAGLALSRLSHVGQGRALPKLDKAASLRYVLENAWFNSIVYDPLVSEASVEDYLFNICSLAVILIRNPRRTFVALLPYLTLLGLFGGFVLWNGGVVLGDKSNHVATLHSPQMLYLWPYMMFFSWPLVLQALAEGRLRICKTPWQILRKIVVLGCANMIALAMVHYNTIIHPFTLADNRHYVFYVFRLLLKHPAVKYLATPVYVVCGYAVMQTLAARPWQEGSSHSAQDAGPRASFLLIWLITTSLSLITAPLVEPRYCILPWMMWRIHVPIGEETEVNKSPQRKLKGDKNKVVTQGMSYSSIALKVETMWFLVILSGTGYLFLFRGFSWPQELGKTQRFMW